MSVLIKGMKMPKKGEYQMTLYVDSDSAYIDVESFPEDKDKFEVIQVPPHGRLIDADELIAKQEEDAEIFMGSTNYGDKVRYDEAMNAVANIVNAPTVIEASEVE